MKSTIVFLNAFVSCVLSEFLCMSVQAQQAPLSPFMGITQAQQICGPPISPDALRGKIVFVEYWGTYCGPCRQSMPHLQTMYNQFGKTGLFCIIGNHVQQYSPDTDKFLKQTGVTFPVFQSLNLPVNRNISSIPRAFVFDMSGKIIAEGHPTEVVNRIPALIQEASLKKKSETLNASDSSKKPAKQSSKIDNSNLDKFPKTAVVKISPEKTSWSENYKNPQKADNLNGKIESQTALTTPDDYRNDEARRLINLAKTDPAKAYVSMNKLNSSIKGVDQEQAFTDVYNPLESDKNVKDLSEILMNIAELDSESESEQTTSTSAKNRAQSLFLSLKDYYYRKDLSQELKNEAFTAAKELKEKYGCSGKQNN